MDLIVNRLAEIELAATRIIDAAALEKKELEKQSQEHLAAYDTKIDEETAGSLYKLKQSLDLQMTQELSKLQSNTQKIIAMIEADYIANHETMAAQILQHMIEE